MLQRDPPLFSRDGGLAYQRLFCSCLTSALAGVEQGRSAADHAAGEPTVMGTFPATRCRNLDGTVYAVTHDWVLSGKSDVEWRLGVSICLQ